MQQDAPLRFVDRIAREQAIRAMHGAHRALNDIIDQDVRASAGGGAVDQSALARRLYDVAASLISAGSHLEANASAG